LFTVAIFGPFLAHFQPHFLHVWQKNDQNDLKNETKNDMNTLESKNNKNEAKMHFTWSLAVLASAWHIQTPPQMT